MEDIEKKRLAEIVRNYRVRQNLSQEKLAQKVDVSLQTIWRIENNEGGKITLETLDRLSKTFGVDLYNLLISMRHQAEARVVTVHDRLKHEIDGLTNEQANILLQLVVNWKTAKAFD